MSGSVCWHDGAICVGLNFEGWSCSATSSAFNLRVWVSGRRVVRAAGICPLPYAVGSRCGNIPPALTPLAGLGGTGGVGCRAPRRRRRGGRGDWSAVCSVTPAGAACARRKRRRRQ
eukprot:631055-Prorocentrum_minimum.AAC.1